ncbi:unnamed protein product [Euphydryas editha]|uniref:Mos1 transposase HTH domain-containing protein n=1 Tax=Euphydryas editha TaxID=104508 RepID=A0AAU9V1I2_EUPED|nr:unnamed protein product [Euphydryas editha]
MEYPGGKNQHFRHLLFFDFHRGQKANEAAREICNVGIKGGVIDKSTAREWFAKLKMEILTSMTRPAAEDLLNSTN